MKKVVAYLNQSVKIVEIKEDRIVFSDRSYITFDHDQDCCEYNYADFDCLRDSVVEDVRSNIIQLESDNNGFLLNGYLVNCYSEQNGYYSTDINIYYKDYWDRTILFLRSECEFKEE